MKKLHNSVPFVVVLVALAAIVCSCRSAPAPQDVSALSAPRLVQAAQEATDAGDYERALGYYQTLRERFPDDVERSLWAAYEIAFLQHKMGDDDEAIRLLDELIKLYADRADPKLPQGPLVLAQKIRGNLVAKKKPQ